MNRCLSFMTCLLSAIMSVSGSYVEASPKNVQKLWADYSEAENADRPAIQLDILQKIINTSFADRLVWDFHEAGTKYINVARQVNWKDYNDVKTRISNRIKDFDEPVLSFVNRYLVGLNTDDSVLQFLEKNQLRLKGACNSRFYEFLDAPSYIRSTIRSDYEYVLWSILHDYSVSKELKEDCTSRLSVVLGQRYPEAAYFEYYVMEPVKDSLEAFSEKYRSKAVALLTDARLLMMKKSLLDEHKAKSEQYLQLRKECEDYERLRASFHGKEAEIADTCTGVADLIKILDSKSLSFRLSGRELSIHLRNLSYVQVRLESSGKLVWSARKDNPVCSYYVRDVIQMELPQMDDGEYFLVCSSGQTEAEDYFKSHSISLAGRRQGENGYAVYAAEYDTGKPVGRADLVLMSKGEEIAVAEDFRFDGFTPLNKEMTDLINGDDSYKYLVCRYKDEDGYSRRSEGLAVCRVTDNPYITNKADDDCRILTDRSAFNPGDTLHYKAILFTRCGNSMKTWESGRHVMAEFIDTEGNTLTTQELRTNAFGSVSGQFVIPATISRNGSFIVRISDKHRILATKRVVVDEFQLPDFIISFIPDDKFYYAGDTVVVKGRAESFSGLLLSGSKAVYSVTSGGCHYEGDFEIAGDGSFEFSFASLKKQYAVYDIRVRIVDPTGETHEQSTYRRISSSFRIVADLHNRADGDIQMQDDHISGYADAGWVFDEDDADDRRDDFLLDGDKAEIGLSVRSDYGYLPSVVPCNLTYRVKYRGEIIFSDEVASGSDISIDLSSWPSGLFELEVKSCCRGLYEMEDLKYSANLIKLSDADEVCDIDNVKSLFKKYDGGDIKLQFASTSAPVWAVCELYDDKGNVLQSEMLHLEGKAGKAGSVRLIEYEYLEDYPDAVVLKVFYFRDGHYREYTETFMRPKETADFPCEFTRFSDSLYPGVEGQFCIRTLPGTEVAVAVFEKSTEQIHPNPWNVVYHYDSGVEMVYVELELGGINANSNSNYSFSGSMHYIQANAVCEEGISLKATKKGLAMRENASETEEFAMEDAAVPALQGEDVIRSDFRSTLAFLPHLVSDSDGNVRFSFNTSEKLSTYYIQVFVHDKELNTATQRKELKVSLPCQVAASVPRYLYQGDIYNLKVSVSNSSVESLDGDLKLELYDGDNYKELRPLVEMSHYLNVEPEKVSTKEFSLNVPEIENVLGLKITYSFHADGKPASDGMFVKIPVMEPWQTIVEAHSAVCLPGMDKKEIEADLKAKFVNVSPDSVSVRYVSLEDMIEEALREQVAVKGDDVLSLLNAYHATVVSASHGGADSEKQQHKLAGKIGDCLNSDGGFAWYPGMKSSEFITAVVLDKLAQLKRYNAELFDGEVLSDAVQFIDSKQFGENKDWGGLSLEQYLYIRSLYTNEPFLLKPDAKSFKKFSKEAREYLFPSTDRTEYAGVILQKARRAHTLLNLFGSDRSLANSWNLKGRYPAILRSLAADIQSISDYAVEHRDGARYFPNAVMPFRGLLENELYAHTMLCRLFDRVAELKAMGKYPQLRNLDSDRLSLITDGIRLWIMLQKETQQWDDNPDFMEAAAIVADGPEHLLSSEIIVMEGHKAKPFDEIKASGNGFRVTRQFYHVNADGSKGEAVKAGEILTAGEKIMAEYMVWSAENRSFVKLDLPRPALLTPCNQMSGYWRAGLRSVHVPGFIGFYPQVYRNVKADRTELSFDVMAEETTVLTEEFFVSQTGRFVMPVVSVRSLYAPHYRANEEAQSPMGSR